MTGVLGHLPCLACPRPHAHTHTTLLSPPSTSIQPHYTKTVHFALSSCRSPLVVWLQRTLIFILGRVAALALAGVRPLLPLLSKPRYKSRMRSEWSCCLTLSPHSNFSAAEFLKRWVDVFQADVVNFPPLRQCALYRWGGGRSVGAAGLQTKCVLFIPYIIPYVYLYLFSKEQLPSLYFLWQDPCS